MDKLSLSTKKAKRIESKKKKAAALLALLEHKAEPKMADTNSNETDTSGLDNEIQSDDVLLEMRKCVRERKKEAMQKPKVFLTLEAMLQFRPIPEEPVKEEELPPLYVMDLQQLLLYGLQGNSSSYKPRWCKLLRVGRVSSVVLLLLEGISFNDYEKHKTNFPFISERFPSYVEMVCPRQYMQTLDRELYTVPLSVSQLKKINLRVPKSIRDSVVAKMTHTVNKAGVDKLSRMCLLLSTYQMMLEGYPLPVQTNIGRYRDFVFTKDKYDMVTANSPIFAVDCEMCTTSIKQNELTRVSIVSETGEIIYDSLVKPKNRIINYLTRFSGITKEMLDPVTTTLTDVQRDIRSILPSDAILCGQSLNGDLMALKMFHPYVIDTSVIFNMSGNRGVKAGLRKLSQFFLGRSIQNSKSGHSSAEDATATLDLVKLKLTKGLEFGDATLSGVYFPDIHTYFMADENSSAKSIQNVEKEANEDEQPVFKRPQISSQAPCDSSVSKANYSDTKTLSVTDHEGKSSSGQRNEKRKSIVLDVDFPGTDTPEQDGSSSTSSSEDDNVDHKNNKQQNKKQKLTDPSQTSLGNNKLNSVIEKSEADSTNVEDLHSNSIVKCKDYSFASTGDLVSQQRQCLFKQENSVHISHSFFRLAYEAGRTGCMIDREDFISQYKTEPIETAVVSTDTEVRRTAKKMVQSKEFVWAHFRGYSDEAGQATQQRQEKLMRKLDNRVQSVIKHAKTNALVVVAMTGRDSDEIPHNMAVFISTT